MDKTRIDFIFCVCDMTIEGFYALSDAIGILIHEDSLNEEKMTLLEAIILNQYKIEELSPAGHTFYRTVSLESDAILSLELLEEILANTRVWQLATRMKANNYIKDIRQSYLLIKQGIHLLEYKHETGLNRNYKN